MGLYVGNDCNNEIRIFIALCGKEF